MNLDPGPATRSLLWWRRLLLAALAAAVVTLLGAGTASAATVPVLETRVGASTLATVSVVGPYECITAGQQWGHAPPRAEPTVATIASAGTVAYDFLACSFDRPPHGALSDNGSSHRRVLQSGAGTAAPDAFPHAVGVAAKTARVFTSADAHVAGAANAIEAALPGRVVGVNGQRLMSNGLSREVDIDLGNILVQVKSGHARGITGQIQRIEASTGVRTVGYAPDISDAAWANSARQGIPILRSPDELLAFVREFG